jgi:hypothetical protein
LIASKLADFGCPKQHGFVLPYQKQVMVMNFVFKNVVVYIFLNIYFFKYIKIIYFYFLKNIFNISALKKILF